MLKLALLLCLLIGLSYELYLTDVFSLAKPKPSDIRPLHWSDINFLATTDTHGWYSGHVNQPIYSADWGDFVSFAKHAKKEAAKRGQDLLLVDSGDRHDGNGLSDISVPNGVNSTQVFLHQDYDILTIGNHELYEWANSDMEFSVVAPKYEGYVSSNVEFQDIKGNWKPFGKKYRFFKTPVTGTKVLSFGFLFDFNRNNKGTRITPISKVVDNEKWFADALKAHDPDIIVVVGHTPVSHEWPEFHYLHKFIRKHHPDVVIQYFGGHSHIRDFTVLDDKATGLQAGRFCETVGFTSVNLSKKDMPIEERVHRRYIDFNRKSFAFHANCGKCWTSDHGGDVKELIHRIREELGLDRAIGEVRESNFYVDYVPIDHPKNLYRLLTERVLPTLPSETSSNKDRVVIINTGSVRYDLYKGDFTIDTRYIVSPFENDWVRIAVPKKIAVKVAETLNNADYITASSDTPQNWRLKPPHHWFRKPESIESLASESKQMVLSVKPFSKQLTKGYVTLDDFGADGDDTPHRAVVNFPIPNVVESVQLSSEQIEDEAMVDLVFYSFLIPNIQWALDALNYTQLENNYDIRFYSNEYLGFLLSDYVKAGSLA
ncbi:hypothetical protein DICA0_F02102 [Diutina catenulata]